MSDLKNKTSILKLSPEEKQSEEESCYICKMINRIFQLLSLNTFVGLLLSRLKPFFGGYGWKVHSDWQDDLIWCPSQCYKKIEMGGRQFVIYLRWRWNDPWTADLVECLPDGNFEMSGKDTTWSELNVGYFRDDQLEELKVVAEKRAYQWITLNPKK